MRGAAPRINPSTIPGYGADADPARRPGVPKERRPEPLPGAIAPPRQQSAVKVFKHGRPGKTMTPVYGTAQPPRGLSGRVRALAYSYPDHKVQHWLLLLMADRVDTVESRLRGRSGRGALTVAGLFLVGVLAARSLAR